MAIWYEMSAARIGDLEQLLQSQSIHVSRIEFDNRVVGFALALGSVSTNLEILPHNHAEQVHIVRHEGIHLAHPIRFWRLQKAIVNSLVGINANRLS